MNQVYPSIRPRLLWTASFAMRFYLLLAVENKRKYNYNGKDLRENGKLNKKNTKKTGETTATAKIAGLWS